MMLHFYALFACPPRHLIDKYLGVFVGLVRA
jgi:hypothetical protein